MSGSRRVEIESTAEKLIEDVDSRTGDTTGDHAGSFDSRTPIT